LMSRLTTALLLVIIVMTTVAMGFTFDSGAFVGSGGGGGGVKAQSSVSAMGTAPHLLVKANVAQQSFPTPAIGPAQNEVPLTPMVGLKFTLTAIEVSISRPGRPLTYFAFTNSSGEGYIAVGAGNYSIQAASPLFNLTRPISFTGNHTTELDLVVSPVYSNVTTLSVVNPDQDYEVEANSAIYVQIPGAFSYNMYTIYRLIGTAQATATYTSNSGEPGIIFVNTGPITINATVAGFYPSPGGTMVVLRPVESYTQLPLDNIQLLQYVANSTVRYIAG
jgi:hypothetical protein